MPPHIVTRRSFLQTAGIVGTALHLPRSVVRHRNRPNILLYVVDDLGANDAGCYGNVVIRTPGLDMLASHGTRFTYAFCTTASCSASRSVVLSGQYNHATGQYGHMHDFHHFSTFTHISTLPVLLGAAGYRTVRAGKYHVAPESVYHFEEEIPPVASPKEMAGTCREVFTHTGDRPFFLYFCTMEPHRPFRREGAQPVAPEEVIVPSYLPDIPACREELARYYMSAERADRGLLELLHLLKETGRWEDTVVVFISDNGLAFPGAKTTLYEPGMRLPCVVRSPHDGREGGICEAMITWADLTPTLLDMAGVATEGMPFHGRSFRTAMQEERPEGWDEIFASHTFHEITMYYPMRVVRGRRYKLLWNIAHGLPYPFASDLWASETWVEIQRQGLSHYGMREVDRYIHRPRFELYDLDSDPHEVMNLAQDPAHASVLEDLQSRMRAHQERTGDPWILKWTYE